MDYIEQNCTVNFQGRKFTANGAFIGSNHAFVYVKTKQDQTIDVTNWRGKKLGCGMIHKVWSRTYPYRGKVTFYQVSFEIDGVRYSGRYSPDNGELVRGVKT